jgi:hypothetical protein
MPQTARRIVQTSPSKSTGSSFSHSSRMIVRASSKRDAGFEKSMP